MICKNCGTISEGNYCSFCGQKHFDKQDLTIKHFIEETFEGFIHFDSKFFRTLKTLISKPGLLSLDYIEGRRARFMKPVQFFLITNIIFFFLLFSNIYSLSLNNYISFEPFTNYGTKEIVNNKLKKDNLTLGEYEQLFDEKMNSNSKEFIFLFIPFYGIIFSILLFFKRKLFVENLVFATHFISFILIYFFVETYLINLPYFLITKINFQQWFDNFVVWLTELVIFFIYFLPSEDSIKHPGFGR